MHFKGRKMIYFRTKLKSNRSCCEHFRCCPCDFNDFPIIREIFNRFIRRNQALTSTNSWRFKYLICVPPGTWRCIQYPLEHFNIRVGAVRQKIPESEMFLCTKRGTSRTCQFSSHSGRLWAQTWFYEHDRHGTFTRCENETQWRQDVSYAHFVKENNIKVYIEQTVEMYQCFSWKGKKWMYLTSSVCNSKFQRNNRSLNKFSLFLQRWQ